MWFDSDRTDWLMVPAPFSAAQIPMKPRPQASLWAGFTLNDPISQVRRVAQESARLS
jgi:hypothetical protein